MTAREECIAHLRRALGESLGLVLTVDGRKLGGRQLAIAALSAAKRELAQDCPEVLDLIIKVVPGTQHDIAIIKVDHMNHD